MKILNAYPALAVWIFCSAVQSMIENTMKSPNSTFETRNKSKPTFTVELAIVCDKEFGDIFQHDKTAIMKYWSLFIRDLNWRFGTLSSSRVLFSVTSITVISSFEEQPFIEESRNELNYVNLNSALDKFSLWVDVKKEKLAHFDAAMLVTATRDQGTKAGLAFVGAACTQHAKVVIRDMGTFRVATAAHELGHLLGAMHDSEIKCEETGFIMGETRDKETLFSNCSNQLISEFFQSNKASCLRQTYSKVLDMLADFDMVVPTMNKQCENLLKNENKVQIKENGTREIIEIIASENSSCRLMKCVEIFKGGSTTYSPYLPVQGTTCKGENITGFCFRGSCLPWNFKYEILLNKTEDSIMDLPQELDNISVYIADSANNTEIKYLLLPYTTFNESDYQTSVICVGYSSKDQMLTLAPCLPNSSLNFQWALEKFAKNIWDVKNTETGKCLGYFDKIAGEIVATGECRAEIRMSIYWQCFEYLVYVVGAITILTPVLLLGLRRYKKI